MTPTIRVLHTLARSGGTIISRCLGCMKGVALLSEIHPRSQHEYSSRRQLSEWYGIDVPDGSLADVLAAGAAKLAETGRTLIVRGRDYLDHVPCEFNDWRPSHTDELGDALSHLPTRHIAILRDHSAVWASMSKHWSTSMLIASSSLSFKAFMAGHARYSLMMSHVPTYRYEAFCEYPDAMLTSMCVDLAVPFDEGWRSAWQSYTKITGDLESLDRNEIRR